MRARALTHFRIIIFKWFSVFPLFAFWLWMAISALRLAKTKVSVKLTSFFYQDSVAFKDRPSKEFLTGVVFLTSKNKMIYNFHKFRNICTLHFHKHIPPFITQKLWFLTHHISDLWKIEQKWIEHKRLTHKNNKCLTHIYIYIYFRMWYSNGTVTVSNE